MPNFMKIRRGRDFFWVDLVWNDPIRNSLSFRVGKGAYPLRTRTKMKSSFVERICGKNTIVKHSNVIEELRKFHEL